MLSILSTILGSYAINDCGKVCHGEAIPDVHDCSKFLLCNNGVLQSTVCPQNYGFNKVTLKCEYNPSCWKNPPVQQNPCLGRPDNTYVPYFASCKLFYFCYGGLSLLKSCPDGYRFDTAASSCVVNTTSCT